MSRNFAADITAQLEADDRDSYAAAQLDTTLADDLRALTHEARRSWLRCATPEQVNRLAVCYAVEDGCAANWPAYAAKLVAKQAELLAEVAGTPATLPPVAAMQETATLLARVAEAAGDTRNRNALNKAALDLASGVLPVLTPDGWLVPSATRGGVVHRVRQQGSVWSCGCEAGERGQPCRHASLMECVATTWELLADDDQGDDQGDDTSAAAPDLLAEARALTQRLSARLTPATDPGSKLSRTYRHAQSRFVRRLLATAQPAAAQPAAAPRQTSAGAALGARIAAARMAHAA
jgi:hypothetical protein